MSIILMIVLIIFNLLKVGAILIGLGSGVAAIVTDPKIFYLDRSSSAKLLTTAVATIGSSIVSLAISFAIVSVSAWLMPERTVDWWWVTLTVIFAVYPAIQALRVSRAQKVQMPEYAEENSEIIMSAVPTLLITFAGTVAYILAPEFMSYIKLGVWACAGANLIAAMYLIWAAPK